MTLSLFKRDWKFLVDNLDVSKLDGKFHIEKSLKATPNKLTLELYNLSPDHAAQIEKRATANKSTGVRVEVSAGYVNSVPLIFNGDAHKIYTDIQNGTRVSLVTALDGGRSYREAQIDASIGPGATAQSLIVQCAQAMGIGVGNTNEASVGAVVSSLGTSFPTGTVLSGKAADELTRLTNAVGLTWSIQNGALQLQKPGKPLQGSSLRLASSTGLVGSPTTDMDASVSASKPKKDKPTHVLARTLLIPGLAPGRIVVLDSASFKGNYQIVQCDYLGDTMGNDWYCNLKLAPY